MPFTEKDLEAQIAMFAELKEEFSRLQVKEATFKKEHGIKDEDLKLDMNKLSQEEKNILAYAEKEAKKAAAARVAQSFPAAEVSSKPSAGAGRKGAIRL